MTKKELIEMKTLGWLRTRRCLRAMVAALSLASLVGIASAAGGSADGRPMRAPVHLSSALTATLHGTGTVQAAAKLNLAFSSQGRIAAVHVQVGQHVRRGQALARVELQAVFARLFQRFPTLRLACAMEDLRFKNALIYGVEELPVTW